MDFGISAISMQRKLKRGPLSQPGHAFCRYALGNLGAKYLESASLLGSTEGPEDHQALVVLYLLRHGVELWLKLLARESAIDRLVRSVRNGQVSSVGGACELLEAKETSVLNTLSGALRLRRRTHSIPECWESATGSEAQEALRCLAGRTLDDEDVAHAWRISGTGHSLSAFWTQGRDLLFGGLWNRAVIHARNLGLPPVEITPDEVQGLVELLDHSDGNGTVFRYPFDSNGDWSHELPAYNLTQMAAVSDQLARLVQYCVDTLDADCVERTAAKYRGTTSS